MIQYLLRIPKKAWEPPERPRREVSVSLMSKTPNGLATLEFSGEAQDVNVVRDTLLYQSSGRKGAIIEADTTPIHLSVAMDGPSMAAFEPEQLKGEVIFHPPLDAINQALERLAEITVSLFSETLPQLPSFNDLARAELIEKIRLILALCDAVCSTPECPDDARAILALLINARFKTLGIEPENLKQTLEESDEFLAIVLLRDIPQSGLQVAKVLHKLEESIFPPAGATLQTLCQDLHSIWHSDAEL